MTATLNGVTEIAGPSLRNRCRRAGAAPEIPVQAGWAALLLCVCRRALAVTHPK